MKIKIIVQCLEVLQKIKHVEVTETKLGYIMVGPCTMSFSQLPIRVDFSEIATDISSYTYYDTARDILHLTKHNDYIRAAHVHYERSRFVNHHSSHYLPYPATEEQIFQLSTVYEVFHPKCALSIQDLDELIEFCKSSWYLDDLINDIYIYDVSKLLKQSEKVLGDVLSVLQECYEKQQHHHQQLVDLITYIGE